MKTKFSPYLESVLQDEERKSEIDALRAELKWAWANLRYEVDYANLEAEHGYCVVCMRPDYDHAEDCQALAHKNAAEKLTKEQSYGLS